MTLPPIGRRRFLAAALSAGAAAALPRFVFPSSARASVPPPPGNPSAEAPGSFDFVFFTDTHIQPELDASHGCDMAFRKIASLSPEFAVMGGDHVFDAAAVAAPRADSIFSLYKSTEQLISAPIHRAIGNHDVFGIYSQSGVPATDPLYGKKMFEDRYGRRTFYSFDHKGYHFIILDSIQVTPDRLWEARIDDDQLDWLSADLKSLTARSAAKPAPPSRSPAKPAEKSTPIIAAVHCPMVTAFATYAQVVSADRKYNTLTVANAPDVLDLLEGHNVLAVLQGHTHINENVPYNGAQYITSGAVCGNWWRGSRMGTPEGFTVVSLRNGSLTTRYETYGFHAVASPRISNSSASSPATPPPSPSSTPSAPQY